ncbi:MAG: division/cell wall cluster transcriptional repressor MraZ [Clostridia bacterium]|nr:division/cell wall cluster transcriptional repressor MraZ [Clostridia bacterium]
MLLGEYYHSLDTKGRLNLPSKFRGDFGETVIITKSSGEKKCLWVFSLSEWEAFTDKIKQLKISYSSDIVRYFLTGANEATIDKQGRIMIPQNLRDFAGLDKEVVVAGVLTKAEIWNKEKYVAATSELTGEKIEEAMRQLEL